MTESRKGTSACTDPKMNKSSLDGEIGNEFLSSWKSLSAAGDDTMDFDFDTVSSGKKKTFNFDKLDMDFNVGGDFDKLSSFEVDMTDLDFSSPSKNTVKRKESSKGDSSSGSRQGKRDCFNFSFDFNELDNFNFDSTLTEGEKTPVKKLDSKVPGSEISEHQGSKANPAGADDGKQQSSKVNQAGADDGKHQESKVNQAGAEDGKHQDSKLNPSGAYDGKHQGVADDEKHQDSKVNPVVADDRKHQSLKVNPAGVDDGQTDEFLASDNTATSVVETTLDGAGTGTSSCDKFHSHGPKSLPEEASAEEADRQSHSWEKTMPTVTHARQATHILPVQVDGNESQNTESSIQAGSLATNVNTEPSTEQHVSDRGIVGGFNHKTSQLKNTAASCTNGSESIRGDSEKTYSDTAVNLTETEPMPDDLDLEATSAMSPFRERPHELKADKNIQKSTSKVFVPLGSTPVVDKVMPKQEKDSEVVGSKFFKSSKEIEPQLCQPPSAGLKISSFWSKGVSSLRPTNGKREGSNVNVAQSLRNLTVNSKSLSMGLAKEEPALPGSEKNVKTPHDVSGNVNLASSTDKAIASLTQTSVNSTAVVSSMGSTWNSKMISVEGLKAGKGTPDLSSLKISRTMGVSKDQSNALLKRETSSLRNSQKNMEVQGITASKIGHLTVNAERKTLLIPSLKRKTTEASNDFLLQLNPRKRLSQSQGESRNLKEPLESTAEEECCNHDNQPEGDPTNVLHNHPNCGLEQPQQLTTKEQNISLAMENDGNVEKAEAYAKELEDICSMLKKKYEEAKEILVRAIVNNNSLLMLNHPMFDEKIRLVQKFAAQLMIN